MDGLETASCGSGRRTGCGARRVRTPLQGALTGLEVVVGADDLGGQTSGLRGLAQQIGHHGVRPRLPQELRERVDGALLLAARGSELGLRRLVFE